MFTYCLQHKVERVADGQVTKLNTSIRGAISELITTVEACKSDSDLLESWATSADSEAVYVVFDSMSVPRMKNCRSCKISLLIQSRCSLALSDHFQVSDIDVSDYRQLRHAGLYDATADYSQVVNEWEVPDDGIIVIRYELVTPGSGNPPHFGADIFLCTRETGNTEPTNIFN